MEFLLIKSRGPGFLKGPFNPDMPIVAHLLNLDFPVLDPTLDGRGVNSQ